MRKPILSVLSNGLKAARAFAELTGKEIVELPPNDDPNPDRNPALVRDDHVQERAVARVQSATSCVTQEFAYLNRKEL
jgi:hypothetical protein